jgi:hypothetical protein
VGHPPRKFTPAIERPDEPGVHNWGFADVPCSIWRFTSDEEEMFEEPDIDVGFHVDYEGDRLIEINVNQRDEYQGERAPGGETALSVYISAADAKMFAAGLQKAIDMAEVETLRRTEKKARQAKRAEAKMLKAKKTDER